jgi:hypothetical protein
VEQRSAGSALSGAAGSAGSALSGAAGSAGSALSGAASSIGRTLGGSSRSRQLTPEEFARIRHLFSFSNKPLHVDLSSKRSIGNAGIVSNLLDIQAAMLR